MRPINASHAKIMEIAEMLPHIQHAILVCVEIVQVMGNANLVSFASRINVQDAMH